MFKKINFFVCILFLISVCVNAQNDDGNNKRLRYPNHPPNCCHNNNHSRNSINKINQNSSTRETIDTTAGTTTRRATNEVKIPNGMSVDINNSAVITGPILSVEQFRTSGLLLQKSIKVPAGRSLTYLVDCGRGAVVENKRYIFEANQTVSLPALEKEKTYRIYVEVNEDLSSILLLTSCRITLRDTTANNNIYSETIVFNPPVRPK